MVLPVFAIEKRDTREARESYCLFSLRPDRPAAERLALAAQG